MDSDLNVDGRADIHGNAKVFGNMEIVGNLDVDADLSTSATFTAAGIAQFQSDVSASAGLDVAGAAHFAAAVSMDQGLTVAGQPAVFQSAASFEASVGMDAALNLSGSAFVNINTPVEYGKYNVNDAIRALDAKAGQQASDINANYAALRYLDSGNFDAQGMKTFTTTKFAAADIAKVTVDVLVKANGTDAWTNDLVSVQVKPGGAGNAFVAFEISAPAMGASDSVRIIAVKEEGNLA
jgi:hypothetical protein